jgi:hypothetical protein
MIVFVRGCYLTVSQVKKILFAKRMFPMRIGK